MSYSPGRTRKALVDSAFHEMMSVGFRAASLDRILARSGMTKGALYHHFQGKRTLGYAVLDEVIRPLLEQKWFVPLADAKDPVDVLQDIFRHLLDEDADRICSHGSPLNNLAQEMSAADEEFRERIVDITTAWKTAIAEAIRRGQEAGKVRENVNADQVATFVVALTEGAAGLTKTTRDVEGLRTCVEDLGHYLEALRPRRAFRG